MSHLEITPEYLSEWIARLRGREFLGGVEFDGAAEQRNDATLARELTEREAMYFGGEMS